MVSPGFKLLNQEDKHAFASDKPRFFAFDSFEGLPEATKVDHHPYLPKHWGKASFAMSQQEFEKVLYSSGIDLQDVHVIKGWYDQTLTSETKKAYNKQQNFIYSSTC